ncbi:tetratricopeptide repeat protein [Thalassospira sp.]|uniref:tetratricopeptide repeat protein n=1 Tax=Thalassospira sp. TaxID=1912094 RepID=UPI0027365DAD|nr:tetratricopeptide repeat protein [Thalassospira sp.]MDP2700023.1 tetratricopeptide repeat protein [Thalassospira sp.]
MRFSPAVPSPTPRRVMVVAFAVLMAAMPLSLAHADYNAGYQAYRAGNYEMARAQWRVAANDNDPRAQYALGLLYYRGQAGPQDYNQAAEWFGRAAQSNHGSSLYYLGLMHFNGWGLPFDQFRATDYFKRALRINPDNLDAAFLIGEQYFRGRGATQNYVDAARYYKQAAEKGMAAAQYMLGAMYERGWGVENNLAESYYWLRRSADHTLQVPPGADLEADPLTAIATLEKRLRPEEINRVEARLQTALP